MIIRPTNERGKNSQLKIYVSFTVFFLGRTHIYQWRRNGENENKTMATTTATATANQFEEFMIIFFFFFNFNFYFSSLFSIICMLLTYANNNEEYQTSHVERNETKQNAKIEKNKKKRGKTFTYCHCKNHWCIENWKYYFDWNIELLKNIGIFRFRYSIDFHKLNWKNVWEYVFCMQCLIHTNFL